MASRKILFLFCVSLLPLYSFAKIQIGRVVAASNGNCNGSIEVLLSGSLGPFTLTLQGNNTTSVSNITDDYTFEGLCTGNYTLSVSGANSDAGGCQSSFNIFVDDVECMGFTVHQEEIIDASDCNNENGGIAFTVENNDFVGFRYETSSGQTGDSKGGAGLYFTVNRLLAGNYDLTITGKNGCVEVFPFEIGPTSCNGGCSDIINLKLVNKKDESCEHSSDGFIEIEMIGGTPPYAYNWAHTSENTNLISSLTEGTYYVTVTDAANCSVSNTFVIGIEDPITLNTLVTNTTCGENNGVIDLTIVGAPHFTYEYSWKHVESNTYYQTEDLNGLANGTYEVTVSYGDKGRCEAYTSAIVNTSNNPLSINMSKSREGNCEINPPTQGDITVNVSGGVFPYTYHFTNYADVDRVWENTSNNVTFQDLNVGTYYVTATDANGCSQTSSFELTDNGNLNVEAAITDAVCGSSTGAISLNVTGGTAPYSYKWESDEILPFGTQGNKDIFGLSPGIYTVSVSESNNFFGCTRVKAFRVGSIENIDVTYEAVAADCFGKGQINITINEGEAPYVYRWRIQENSFWNTYSSFENTYSIPDLDVETYELNVSDNAACSSTEIKTIDYRDDLLQIAQITPTPPSCTAANGAITVRVENGFPLFAYTLTNNAGINENITSMNPSETFVNLPIGIYTITVTDAAGCISSEIFELKDNSPFNVQSIQKLNATCGNSNGSITVETSNGAFPTIDWEHLSGGADGVWTISNLAPGVYNATVMDNQGCTRYVSEEIINTDNLRVNFNSTDSNCSGSGGSITMTVTSGNPQYTYYWKSNSDFIWNQSNSTNEPSKTISSLDAGEYDVKVSNAEGCQVISSVEIIRPSGPRVSYTSRVYDCDNGGGRINTTVSGGSGNYVYMWKSDQEPNIVASRERNLVTTQKGLYRLYVTDISTGCDNYSSKPNNRPSEGRTLYNKLSVIAECNWTQNLGQYQLKAYKTGGSSEIDFSWSGPENISEMTGTVETNTPGYYTVSITDGTTGCTAEGSATCSGGNTQSTSKKIGNYSGSREMSK